MTRYDIKSCAYGTLYNSRIKQCDFPSRVDCNANRQMAKKQNEAVVEGNRQNTKLVSMTCPPDFVGTKPHPESCQKFIECVSGKCSETWTVAISESILKQFFFSKEPVMKKSAHLELCSTLRARDVTLQAESSATQQTVLKLKMTVKRIQVMKDQPPRHPSLTLYR